MSKKIAFLFPGQGSQAIGMGKDFYDNSQIAKNMFDRASKALSIDMTKLLFEQNDDINETEFSQPAILLISLIALEIFKKEIDIKPSITLGHSLGEFSALYQSGAISFEDAVLLVHKRGLYMKEACKDKNAGMMVILGLEDCIVEEICYEARDKGKQIWAANYNCDGQIVVAGIKKDLEEYSDVFKEKGAKRAKLLAMSVASHCPLLQSARAPLKNEMNTLLKDVFKTSIISNVDASVYNTKEKALSLLESQLVKPVLYKQSIINNPADIYIEFGSSVLKGLNKKIIKEPTLSIVDFNSLNESVSFLKNELGEK